mmetsp:Transcript_3077/g.4413  ORF Transcript_3077/g.4413 Transcript_3077/m.4413 type:complete len:121 (-) Transcript_3077:423-785(-)
MSFLFAMFARVRFAVISNPFLQYVHQLSSTSAEIRGLLSTKRPQKRVMGLLGHLHLSALHDNGVQPRFALRADGNIFYLSDYQHALNHPPKYNVLRIQPVAHRARNEKLAPVCVRAAVSH